MSKQNNLKSLAKVMTAIALVGVMVGINLPLNRHLKPLLDYQTKIFARPSFQDSLSLIERDLRD